jgi:small subunit ribosomal protein S17
MNKEPNNSVSTEQEGLSAATSAAQAGKFLEGVVVKSAMKDTVTVQVERYVMHSKYKKFMKRSKKFLVHNPGNTAIIGEKVTIRETRPISKLKRFIIVK